VKTLWTIINALILVHCAAIALFVLWLWQTGRIDGARVQQVRELFRSPVAVAKAEEAARADEAARQDAEAAEHARKQDPPLPSAVQVRLTHDVGAEADQAMQRVRDEGERLAAELARRESSLREEQADLDRAKKAWETSIAGSEDAASLEQFRKSVKLYESVPPKQAKQMLTGLIDGGARSQAVAYLDAMNPRTAAKILREFKSEEELKLASGLLEEIRTRGTPSKAPTDADDASAPP